MILDNLSYKMPKCIIVKFIVIFILFIKRVINLKFCTV